MLTADQIEAIGDQAQQLLSPVVEYLIEDIAKRISEAGQLTSTAEVASTSFRLSTEEARSVVERIRLPSEAKKPDIHSFIAMEAIRIPTVTTEMTAGSG